MRVTEVEFGGKTVQLISEYPNESSNVVTLLMGDNGSGKSRLFQVICSSFLYSSFGLQSDQFIKRSADNILSIDEIGKISYCIDENEYEICRGNNSLHRGFTIKVKGVDKFIQFVVTDNYSYEPKVEASGYLEDEGLVKSLSQMLVNEYIQNRKKLRYFKNGVEVEEVIFPDKLLAVTGSPFDKFPYFERNDHFYDNKHNNRYIYLGSRSRPLAGANYNNKYLITKFNQLGASFIKLFLKPKQEHLDFSILFDFLGLSSKFTLHLLLNERVRKEEITTEKILGCIDSVRFFKDKNRGAQSDKNNENNVLSTELISAFKIIFGEKLEGLGGGSYSFEGKPLDVEVDFELKVKEHKYLNALILLVEFDLIDLKDITFTKTYSHNQFFLSQASSGELSLLFCFSSIAGEITDGSLVLVDEPELSLHPEWQAEFIPLLMNVFKHYKSCHFIISTHSPSIIASVPKDNSYIVDVSRDEPMVISGKEVRHKSVDYQMAEVFGVPQHGNEHLNRICVNTLSLIAKNGNLTKSEMVVAEGILHFEFLIPEGDYVRDLISIVRVALVAVKKVNFNDN